MSYSTIPTSVLSLTNNHLGCLSKTASQPPKTFVFLILMVVVSSAGMLYAVDAPTELQCQYLDEPINPTGIETPAPRFDWKADTNTVQSAWQLIVSEDSFDISIGEGTSWDSDKIYSDNEYTFFGSTGVAALEELKANTEYYWAVRTWDEFGSSSTYSSAALFEMNHFIIRQAFEYPSEKLDVCHTVGDINNNGAADFGVARYDRGTVDIYINDGAGSFYRTQSITGTYSRTAAFMDINNNGWLDLVIANDTGGNDDIKLYFNDGSGNFHFSRALNQTNTGSRAIAVGDINRNGYMDFVEALFGDPNRIFFNNGAGSFQNPVDLPGGSDNTTALALADLNGNTYLDIIVANHNEPNRVYLNNGAGGFTQVSITDEGNYNSRGIAVSDINGNGSWDFITANADPNASEKDVYYINDGAGNFALDATSTEDDHNYSISAGDITGNGSIDFAMGNSNTSNRLYEYEGFRPFPEYRNSFSINTEPRSLILYDFTGDGRLDMLWGLYQASDILLVNNFGPINPAPDPPSDGFAGVHDGSRLKLQWNHGSSAATADAQLAYNIRVSTSVQVKTDPEDGPWSVVSGAIATTDKSGAFWGNIGRSTYVYLNIPSKTYFWQVQAINTAKKAGVWSAVQTVNTPPEGRWTDTVQRGFSFIVDEYPSFNYSDSRRGLADVKFQIKDKESNDVYLTGFEYSTATSGPWHQVVSTATGLTSPGGENSSWPDNNGNNFSTLEVYSATDTFLWGTRMMEHIGTTDFESAEVKLRFNAVDIHGATSTVIESDSFYIDNLNPTPPGELTPTDDYSKNHITFSLGAPSADSNFREYIIFWRDEPGVDHGGDVWYTDYVGSFSAGYESILGSADYGGASTVTISGLTEDTTYYFKVYAYDDFGNYSSSSEVIKKTNHSPQVTILSAEQRRDGSGLVDIVFEGIDHDVEMSTYVETGSYYRIGAADPVSMTPARDDGKFEDELLFEKTVVSSYTFVWDVAADIGEANYDNIRAALRVTDGYDESVSNLYEAFSVDTEPPVPGNLASVEPTATTIDWEWAEVTSVMEPNFDRYELWYSSVAAEYAIDRDTASARVITINNRSITSTTTYGLSEITNYWGCLWVYDTFGYESRTSTVSERTGYPPEITGLPLPEPYTDGSGSVALIAGVGDMDGDDVRLTIEYSRDYNPDTQSGSWDMATISASGSADYESGSSPLFAQPGDYQITRIETFELLTDTNTVYFTWRSKDDIPGIYNEEVYIKITPNDGFDDNPGIDGDPVISEPFKIDNSRPKFLKSLTYKSTYSYTGVFKVNFESEDSAEPTVNIDSATVDFSRIVFYDQAEYTDFFDLTGSTLISISPDGDILEIELPAEKSNTIARWDAVRRGDTERPFAILYSSVAADNYGNYTIGSSSITFGELNHFIYWDQDRTDPEVIYATYTISGGDIHLLVEFNEFINVDGADLTGFTIQNAQSDPTGSETLNNEDYSILTTESDSYDLVINIPNTGASPKHDIIWVWEQEGLWLSVSTWAVSDLSGNSVAESVIEVETDISTETPKILYTQPGSNATNVGRRDKIAIYLDQYLNLDEALKSIKVVQVSDSTGEEVYSIIKGTISAVNYSAVENSPYGEIISSITFISDEKLPGNSDIQITVLADKIRTFADVALEEDYNFKFTTTLVKDNNNLVVSPSGRMSVFIPSGEFPSDGQVVFTEGLPSQEPVMASLVALNAANRAEEAWENRYRYPFEELTFEVVFISSSGASGEMIFESNAEIVIDYSDFIIEEEAVGTGEKVEINYIKEDFKSPVSEETLNIFYLAESGDAQQSRWIPLSTVRDTEEKTLRAPLKHFSVYTVMGGPVFDLLEAHPYPVPYKPSQRPEVFENTLRAGITFTKLPAECDIEIYTITGRLVNSFHHSDADLPQGGQVGNYYWHPVENSSGQPVASGTYIYHLTSGGNTKTGKLMIIR